MSIFFDLFNPNNRHRTEELRRLENTREEDGQAEPGRGPIDLNSGAVLIRVPAKESGATTQTSQDADLDDLDPEGATVPDAESSPEDGDAAVPGQEGDGGV